MSTSVAFSASAWDQLHLTGLPEGNAHAFSKGKTKDSGIKVQMIRETSMRLAMLLVLNPKK